MAIRIKTYANKDDKTANKVGHIQASGTVEEFQLLLKDKAAREAFDESLKKTLGSM